MAPEGKELRDLLLREFLLKNSPSYKSSSEMSFISNFILYVLSYVINMIVVSSLILVYLYVVEFKMTMN